MRVLVTRPRIAAEKTVNRLEALGHEPVALALFEPVHDLDAVSKSAIEPASGLVLTSSEAIRALETIGKLPEDFLALPVFAVGEKTAEAAQNLGFASIKIAEGDGKALAGLIVQSHQKNSTPLLYLAGEPRSPALEEALSAHDIAIKIITAYRMQALEITAAEIRALFFRPVDAILLYSQMSAKRFFALATMLEPGELQAALGNANFLCLSPAIANIVPRHFAAAVRIAQKPSETSLFELL